MKKPDSDISPLMWVQMDNGVGAIHVSTIMTILPDMGKPKSQSLIVTSVFTDGITVHGKSEDLIMEWYEQVMTPEEEEEEYDHSSFQSIGDLIAEHMAVDLEEEEVDFDALEAQLITEASEAFGGLEDDVVEKQQTSDEFTGLKLV